MLNSNGSAARKLLIWLLVIIIFGALGAGVWYGENGGWSGTIAGTWDGLKRDLNIGGGSPAVSVEQPYQEEIAPNTSALPGAEQGAQPSEGTTPQQAGAAPQIPGIQSSPSELPGTAVTSQGGNSPVNALKSCVELLKADDLIGAEQYVSAEGMKFTLGNTTGIHEVLWKGLFKLHSFDEVGYDQARIAGQTAYVPLYTRLGQTRMYTTLVMANRGDGWKLEKIVDARKL